jgi:hypothetical protein
MRPTHSRDLPSQTRRSFVRASAALALAAVVPTVPAAGFSDADAARGLKEALVRGAEVAVQQLGRPDGFLGDERVRIPLPDGLRQAEKLMRKLGASRQADELVQTMNHAAEQAVVQARPILVEAVRRMSFDDARRILTGDDDAATQYFRQATSASLEAKFLPVVRQATARVKLAEKYDAYAGAASRLGLVSERDAHLDTYVTRKTLDGLFLMVAEQERAIRRDPVATGSKLLRKVFGR